MKTSGSIYQTPSGAYRIRYMKDGVKRTKNVHVKSIKEAKAILAQLISDVNNNTYQDKSDLSFYDVTKLWLEHHAIPNLSPTTVEGYKVILNKIVLERIGAKKITSVTKMDVQDIITELKSRGLTSKTQKRYFQVVNTILNYAVENDILKYNPAASIKIRPNSMEQKTEMQIYNHEEINLLFEALDKEEDKELVDMILIDLYTGLRRGELMGLMVKDYNPIDHTLSISRNRVKEGGKPIIKDTKNHKARTFLLSDDCCLIFDKLCKGKPKNDLLFPMHPDTFTTRFKRFLKKNKLKDIRVYDLRHTNASMLHSEGIDYATIAARIGNLPSTTANFYIHKVSEKDEKAKEVLNNIFSRKD